MPRGASGRVVVEIDPHLKRQLYSRLAAEGTTLKHWFLEAAERFLMQGDKMPRSKTIPTAAKPRTKE